MASIPKKLFRGTIPTTFGTVATVPTSKIWVVTGISLVGAETSTSNQKVSLQLGGVYYLYNFALPPSDTAIFDGVKVPLVATEVIAIGTTTGHTATAFISGVELDV